MVDISQNKYWEEDYEDKQPTAKNKLLTIGITAFSICAVINTILICAFFNILTKL